MFISDRFVYLELHKTGCTHIRNTLRELLGGEFVGKHNKVTADLFRQDKFFLGSVRDPWSWYMSLWAYGCDNKGAVFNNVTGRNWYQGLGWLNNPYHAFGKLLKEVSRDTKIWKETYADVNDAAAFRQWLYMVHDKNFMSDIRTGYGTSSVARVVGLMTFRYLALFCTQFRQSIQFMNLTTLEQVQEFEQANCFINYFIRNEALEADLFVALSKCGEEFSEGIKQKVLAKPKTNTSSIRHDTAYYYDHNSAQLVAQREKLIIDKFGYQCPFSED